jgi:hypothetical protein
MAARKTAAKAAKGNGKAKGKATQAAETEKRENRYLRGSRILVAEGQGIDLAELAVRSQCSVATAGHVREAYIGICQALTEAGILPQKALKAKDAPQAPKAPATRQTPEKAPEKAVEAEQAA